MPAMVAQAVSLAFGAIPGFFGSLSCQELMVAVDDEFGDGVQGALVR